MINWRHRCGNFTRSINDKKTFFLSVAWYVEGYLSFSGEGYEFIFLSGVHLPGLFYGPDCSGRKSSLFAYDSFHAIYLWHEGCGVKINAFGLPQKI